MSVGPLLCFPIASLLSPCPHPQAILRRPPQTTDVQIRWLSDVAHDLWAWSVCPVHLLRSVYCTPRGGLRVLKWLHLFRTCRSSRMWFLRLCQRASSWRPVWSRTCFLNSMLLVHRGCLGLGACVVGMGMNFLGNASSEDMARVNLSELGRCQFSAGPLGLSTSLFCKKLKEGHCRIHAWMEPQAPEADSLALPVQQATA